MSHWYPVRNDLAGGYAVGNRDKPLSEYDFRRETTSGDYLLADGMRERDARAVAALLTLLDYPETPLGALAPDPQPVRGNEREAERENGELRTALQGPYQAHGEAYYTIEKADVDRILGAAGEDG